MEILKFINYLISIGFTAAYAYQFLYIPISLLFKNKKEAKDAPKDKKYAVLICARNESAVIGDLIDSIDGQTYGRENITIFVMADNCTDGTSYIAESKGAVVYRRYNNKLIGKGYAMKELMNYIHEDYPEGFDGYFVFDADNILMPNYIEEMHKTYCEGHPIVTGYRNSKNYGDNWISAGSALWFLRESRYLNLPRHLIGSSCAVSGTGFMFGREIAEEIRDWPYHLLVEDIEFSVDQMLKGRKIAFCKNAELFDEQPVTMKQSIRQRMRWSKGYLQVVKEYGKGLISHSLKGSFSCFDTSMNIMPAFILSAVSIICNLALITLGLIAGDNIMVALQSFAQFIAGGYMMLFGIGFIATLTEWKHIRTSALKKIIYSITFPVFMFTYLPISIVSLFKKVEWKPIHHNVSAESLKRTALITSKADAA